ncbi:hypothetical protein [Rhizobium anhuiense]|uniref:Uncharacterized protein n=1 Tax=Rhizobium anhuiense TaxID=1184720 RepID=A0A432NB23_9HYPH|nr:hypothetical protein [Rhizobium anhuiense]RUL96777.1 hypothetical protein EEQ99_29055 [Rhizobium anhuiense]GGE08926.1 hypothetical protein GCM10008012_59750 [Rhizobium anhuiense]
MKTCKAGGCSTQTNGFSSYCERHKRTKARHGHPQQTGVKKSDLKQYLKEIESYLKTVSASNANDIIDDIWSRTVAKAKAHIDGTTRGVSFNVHELQAAQAIVSLSWEADSKTICCLLMAMGFWYEYDQRRWKYDEGFRFQTVRMLLRLNPREAAYKWSVNGLTRSVYREIPPRTIRALWSIIEETKLVLYGMEIARRKARALAIARQKASAERDAILGPEQTGGEA